MKEKIVAEDCLLFPKGYDFKAEMDKHDREMDACFIHDKKLNYITINIMYEYDIALRRISDFQELMVWTYHLAGKGWMETKHIKEFIKRVCEIKGWDYNKSC